MVSRAQPVTWKEKKTWMQTVYTLELQICLEQKLPIKETFNPKLTLLYNFKLIRAHIIVPWIMGLSKVCQQQGSPCQRQVRGMKRKDSQVCKRKTHFYFSCKWQRPPTEAVSMTTRKLAPAAINKASSKKNHEKRKDAQSNNSLRHQQHKMADFVLSLTSYWKEWLDVR